MQVALQRLEGVDQVVISRKKQMFAVTFKPGSSFHPQILRDAATAAHIRVVRFHVSVLGQVEEEGEKQFLVSGENRYLVVDSPKLPPGIRLGVIGVVDDSTDPFQLKVADFRPLKKDKDEESVTKKGELGTGS